MRCLTNIHTHPETGVTHTHEHAHGEEHTHGEIHEHPHEGQA